jgi:hypothetical protein
MNNLTPKEKAEELVLQFYEVVKNIYPSTNGMPLAKKCALRAVDEIINTVNMCIPYQNEETYVSYWQEVKKEIEKL